MKKKTTNKVGSTHANASAESNVGGKEREAKFVVTRLECGDGSETKQVSVVGIYDSADSAFDAMMDDMFIIMGDGGYGCYIEQDDVSGHVSWQDEDYWWCINKVAA